MSRKNDEPPLWLTVLKLILVAAALIGGVGLALWWADQNQSQDTSPAIKSSDPWGIVNDSPLNFRR